MHKSIATLDSPEFLNLQPNEINPLMSECEIKVLYTGGNRNHSWISKDVATEMAKTLRGAPIVGYYKSDKDDFRDHGHEVVIEDGEVHFNCKTVPYGFVSPTAQVWFKKYEEEDSFGNPITREYLMTTGYIWTGQFEEAKIAVEDEGKPQSMELDEKTLHGEWAWNDKEKMDFFIIHDATFSKLCILGSDVEPCFEGSTVTAPEISKTFNLDDNFKNTLFTMMQDLKNALGGQEMNFETEVEVTPAVENVEFTETEASVENTFTEETSSSESESVEFKKEEDSEEKKDTEEQSNTSAEEEDEKKKVAENACGDDKKKDHSLEVEESFTVDKAEFEALQNQYEELQTKFEVLAQQNEELLAFKKGIDDAKKEELINSFYMIAEEDKKELMENKSNYSYDEIKAKLSILFTEKNFDFNKKEEIQEEKPAMTFSLEQTYEAVSPLAKALEEARNRRK